MQIFLADSSCVPRYCVTVLAHRSSVQLKRVRSHVKSEQVEAVRPWPVGSAVMEIDVVRAESAAFARDVVLVQVMAASALFSEAAVVVDAVCVERLRWGRRPVRELV